MIEDDLMETARHFNRAHKDGFTITLRGPSLKYYADLVMQAHMIITASKSLAKLEK
jgi:hypothetical protein